MTRGWARQDRQWWMVKKKKTLKHHVTQSPSIHSNLYSQLSVRNTFSASFARKPTLIARNLRPAEYSVAMGSPFSCKFVLGACQPSAPVNYVHSLNTPIFKRLQVQFQQGFSPNTHSISFPPSAER